MSVAYYNERDPYAAQWLRNLIAAGHVAPGEVDERSITEINPNDLRRFTQCHFFAGIGVWSHGLRRAGWADDAPVWTGSCPCQPFSAAGKQAGFADERHLWPLWFELIKECRPAIVLGEQVASALDWLDLVSADLEGAGYAFAAADLCAAGFSGAHIRQRLYFVAHADRAGRRQAGRDPASDRAAHRAGPGDRAGDAGAHGLAGGVVGLADPDGGLTGQAGAIQPCGQYRQQPQDRGVGVGGLGNTDCLDAGRDTGTSLGAQARSCCRGQVDGHSCDGADVAGRDGGPDAPRLGRHAVDWLYCRDGKWRPVEPGTFPLADAAPQRVGRLRAYGNALDAETASEFAGAVLETLATDGIG